MKGYEEYKNDFRTKALRKVESNNDILYLEDFYYYIAKKEPTSVYNYINYVVNFLRQTGITDPHNITFGAYNKYTAMMVDKTPSYQIAVYSALKKYSAFLFANNICPNYMEQVERPKNYERQETKEKREKSVLSKDELSVVLNNILNSNENPIWKKRDYAITLLFVTSGIRNSALYKLDVNNVDFNNGTIIVTEKRDNVREIILPDKTLNALKEWINIRSTLKPNTEALFISNQKTRMSSRSIYRIANKYGSVDGKNGHPHIFRSTYGTILWETSGDLYLTQKNMGHSNPKTTELYIRGKDADIKKRSAQIMEMYI